MYLRTLLIMLVLGALILFAAINWTAYVSPFKLSVVFTTVEAPLGLVLLGIAGLLTLLFLIYIVFLQSSSLLESRRQARELQKVALQNENAQAALMAKLEELERGLRSTMEQSVNSLAAYMGEIDDKLEKAAGGSS